MARRRAAVLISGRGSNLGALAAAAEAPGYPAEIALVLSDNPAAAGLAFAREAGIAGVAIERSRHRDKAAFEAAIDAALRDAGIELVCLAGFMRILSDDLVARWKDRILNIHPSLLPLFPGLDTHARALAAGVRLHGATVHFVRAAVDAGPIVAQGAVPVLADDTPETLAARVLKVEHRLYPLALELVASGRACVSGEHVLIAGGKPAAEDAALLSPAS
jgi:formyltetrahydrofolate-dependent phosphoribosylglycinamide formyltransferase